MLAGFYAALLHFLLRRPLRATAVTLDFPTIHPYIPVLRRSDTGCHLAETYDGRSWRLIIVPPTQGGERAAFASQTPYGD